MKTFVYLLALTAVLLGGAGCKRKPPIVTPLPAGATRPPGPDGGANPFTNPNGGRSGAVPTNDQTTSTTQFDPNQGYQLSNRPDGMIPDAEAFRSETVYFDYDMSSILPGEAAKVDVVAERLKADATTKVEVAGHCDERGTEEYNRSLGERRAQSIRELLITKGIAPERINTVSFGENQPAVTGQSEDVYAKNRRGEFILLRAPQAR